MKEYTITQISNGWILQGPRHKDELGVTGIRAEIFPLTIHAAADVLTTWEASGFPQAAQRAADKWGTG